MLNCYHKDRIHLILNYEKNKVMINKCCAFVENVLDSFSIEEFEKQDPYVLCKSYFGKNAKSVSYNCNLIKDVCKNNECDILNSIEVSFSQICNLNCNMCFMPKPHYDTEQSKKLYFDTLYKLKGHKLKSIRLTDQGEPFFYKDETMKYLKSLDKTDFEFIEATSNILCLDEDYIKELANLKIPLKIVVSFDTLNASKYKQIRTSKDYDKFIYNFNLIKKYNLLDSVNSVYQKLNVYEIFKMKDIFKSQNIKQSYVFIKDIYDEEHGLSESKINLINSKIN